jgi:hypothetical protein
VQLHFELAFASCVCWFENLPRLPENSMAYDERAVQRILQVGSVPMTSLQLMCELQRDWARGETYEGCMEIFKAHSAYGVGARYAKQILGAHANEGGL